MVKVEKPIPSMSMANTFKILLLYCDGDVVLAQPVLASTPHFTSSKLLDSFHPWGASQEATEGAPGSVHRGS